MSYRVVVLALSHVVVFSSPPWDRRPLRGYSPNGLPAHPGCKTILDGSIQDVKRSQMAPAGLHFVTPTRFQFCLGYLWLVGFREAYTIILNNSCNSKLFTQLSTISFHS